MPNDLSSEIEKLSEELLDKIGCLQRAVASMCAAYYDFRAEYLRDITEVKRQLQELRRNKVWIPRENA